MSHTDNNATVIFQSISLHRQRALRLAKRSRHQRTNILRPIARSERASCPPQRSPRSKQRERGSAQAGRVARDDVAQAITAVHHCQ